MRIYLYSAPRVHIFLDTDFLATDYTDSFDKLRTGNTDFSEKWVPCFKSRKQHSGRAGWIRKVRGNLRVWRRVFGGRGFDIPR